MIRPDQAARRGRACLSGREWWCSTLAASRSSFAVWLFVGSGVMVRLSPHQSCEEGAEESFAAAPGVVHELEEAEIKWYLLL